MGRPLNKKYFGNTNTGSDSTTADDYMGGKGVAGVSITNGGTYTTKPTVTFSTPTLLNGVRATGTTVMAAKSATVTTSGTGDSDADYAPGDLLTVSGGTGTSAVFSVDSIKIRTIAVVDDGDTVWTTNDTVTFGGAGWTTPAVITITAAGGAITGLAITNAGVRTGAPLADPATPTAHSVQDGGGYGATAPTFNIGFGVNAVSVDTAGAYTAIASGPRATTTNSANGTGCTLTVSYEVSDVTMTENGSGYVNAADAAVTFSAGTAAADAVLTTTQHAAITAYAITTNGGTLQAGDIVKQLNDKMYRVETADGVGDCILTSTEANAEGEMNIRATDSSGKTYYVSKLTARKAVVNQYGATGWEFDDGASVQWTFGDAVENVSVKIENA